MEKVTELSDVYLASAVSLILNIQPDLKVHNRRTLFCFPASDELYKAMNEYNNGTLLNAVEYAQMIKRLRAEMLMRRKMEGK